MGRTVCFLGVAASPLEREQITAQIPDDAEIWVVNEAHRMLGDRKPDRVFQLHVRDWREAERTYLNHGWLPDHLDYDCFGRDKAHVAYLRTCGVPVYGQQVWSDIPTSVRYPFEEVTSQVGIPLPPEDERRLWATSSFGYMAALLLSEHYRSHSELAGINGHLGDTVSELICLAIELPLGTWRERTWEWPNFAYYLGLAKGLGITVTLPQHGTSLLSAPHYALDGRPWPGDPDHWHVPGRADIVRENGIYRLGAAPVLD